MLNSFLSGAIVLASWMISAFFFRFRKTTGDRLFGLFAAAFFLLGLERVGIEFMSSMGRSYVYLVRLFAFFLILFAILDKNRAERKP